MRGNSRERRSVVEGEGRLVEGERRLSRERRSVVEGEGRLVEGKRRLNSSVVEGEGRLVEGERRLNSSVVEGERRLSRSVAPGRSVQDGETRPDSEPRDLVGARVARVRRARTHEIYFRSTIPPDRATELLTCFRVPVTIAQTEEVLLRVYDQLKDMSSIQIPVSSGLTIASMARSQEKLHKMNIVFKTLVEGKNAFREAVHHLMRRNSGIAHYLMAD